MDKELPKSKMTVKPGKLFVKLSKSQLPGQKPFYKGTLPNHPTLTIEDIAARAVKARSSYRHGTFVEVFRTMIEEMYGAIHDGFNVQVPMAFEDYTYLSIDKGQHGSYLPIQMEPDTVIYFYPW